MPSDQDMAGLRVLESIMKGMCGSVTVLSLSQNTEFHEMEKDNSEGDEFLNHHASQVFNRRGQMSGQ